MSYEQIKREYERLQLQLEKLKPRERYYDDNLRAYMKADIEYGKLPGEESSNSHKLLTVIQGMYGDLEREWTEAHDLPLTDVIPVPSGVQFNLNTFWMNNDKKKRYVLASYCNESGVSKEITENLFEQLTQMAQSTQDFRQQAFVDELRPVFDKNAQNEDEDENENDLSSKKSTSKEKLEIVRHRACVQDLIDPGLNAFVFRNQKGIDQQWIPAEIKVEKDGQVSQFLSEINNLDHQKYHQFSPLCCAILSKMIPHFEYIVGKTLRDRSLQVIVKAQVYQVWPGGFYSGSLHCEGTDFERIKAVGIYYVDIDQNQLKGGKLELVNAMSRNSNTSIYRSQIHVKKDQIVVFNNDGVFHKMSKLEHINKQTENKDNQDNQDQGINKEKPAQRWILAFFLVDPDHPIPSSLSLSQTASLVVFDGKNIEQVLMHRMQQMPPMSVEESLALRTILRNKRGAYSQKLDPRLKERYGGQD